MIMLLSYRGRGPVRQITPLEPHQENGVPNPLVYRSVSGVKKKCQGPKVNTLYVGVLSLSTALP